MVKFHAKVNRGAIELERGVIDLDFELMVVRWNAEDRILPTLSFSRHFLYLDRVVVSAVSPASIISQYLLVWRMAMSYVYPYFLADVVWML